MSKYKFIPRPGWDNAFTESIFTEEDSIEVKPLFPSCPNGELEVRSAPGKRKLYRIINSKWFFMYEEIYNAESNIAKYFLFPTLTPNDWKELQKHYVRLSPLWKNRVDGYYQWVRLREIRREIRSLRFKQQKEL